MYHISTRTSAFVNTITLQRAYCISLFLILLEDVALLLHPVSFPEFIVSLLSKGSVLTLT